MAYHGIPEKAYEVFVNALKTRYLEQGLIIPELEDHNPAGTVTVGTVILEIFIGILIFVGGASYEN